MLHDPSPPTLALGPARLRIAQRDGFGLVLLGPADPRAEGPTPYLSAVFADPMACEAFYALVDREGLVVCRNLEADPALYKPVRGKRTAGRLSQGEFFHHDGCSTPTRPRVVEIRCPPQDCVRTMGTSVAPFPDIVATMLDCLPDGLHRTGGLDRWRDAIAAQDAPDADWDRIQGHLNRVVRALPPQQARDWLGEVDARAGAYHQPWTLSESRFMANENLARTVQHRRACQPPWHPGLPNGRLLKRWPGHTEPVPGTPNEPDQR